MSRLIGRSWMYRTKTLEFRSFIEEGDLILITTNQKTLSIEKRDLSKFSAECLPIEDTEIMPAAAPKLIAKPTSVLQPTIAEELLQSMMGSLRELDDAENADELKTAVSRASAKSKAVSSITNLVKVQLMATKMAGQ
jgi:hypothetical protein